MSEFILKDFSAGWCPSDDSVGGRKNALLKMNSVELDANGALTMSGGLKRAGSAFSGLIIHTLFSRFFASTRYRYSTYTNGTTYRNNTSIKTGGSATRTAFCAAFDYILGFSDTKRFRDDGTNCVDIGQTVPAGAPTVSLNGAGVLTGEYEWVQINVFKNGAYVAKSAISTISSTLSPSAQKVQVTAQNVTSPSNEVWIFRRGGNLDQFYRVKVLTSSYTTPFDDNMSDETALDYGITLDLLAVPVNSTSLADSILEAVGPVNRRLVLFTKDTINFTEVNSPESYVPTQSINYSGNSTTGAEVFMWARKVGDSTILVGTSHDIYRLDGTYVTQPDGTLDVYLRALGIGNPPISIDCDVYHDAGVVYMAADGWHIVNTGGQIVSDIIAPNVDRLYRGQTCNGFGGVPIYPYPAVSPVSAVVVRYACAVARNKLWVVVPVIANSDPAQAFTYRLDVFDFTRKYWRSFGFAAPLVLFSEEDDNVLGWFASDQYIKDIDYQFAKTLDDGSSTKQTISILTTFQDADSPRNRKDLNTFKLRVNTGGDNLAISVYKDNDESSAISLGNVSSSTLAEKQIDIHTLIGTCKNFQILLTGQVADFRLTDISVDYDARPEQTMYKRFECLAWGPERKRVRTIPIIIDTLGNNVTVTPVVDGASKTASTFNVNRKSIEFHYFGADGTPDVIGVNFGLIFSSTGLFELYDILQPEIVHTFPIQKKYDQLGPVELFKYGKVQKIRIRIMALGSGNIPYAVYFEDVSIETGNIAVTGNVENVFELTMPKTVAGTLLRIVLGPVTDFTFQRYYAQVLCSKSGRDTENEWIPLGIEQ